MKLNHLFPQSIRVYRLWNSLVTGAFTTMCLVSGLTPDLSGGFNSVAYAQTVSNQEVTNYAHAVLEMEPVRQNSFNQIRQILGKTPPSIVCDQPESVSTLTDGARKIAEDYCEQSKAIVEKNGLSISQFNSITMEVQEDPDLKKRVEAELVRLQSGH